MGDISSNGSGWLEISGSGGSLETGGVVVVQQFQRALDQHLSWMRSSSDHMHEWLDIV